MVCLCLSLSVCLFVCPSVRLFVRLSAVSKGPQWFCRCLACFWRPGVLFLHGTVFTAGTTVGTARTAGTAVAGRSGAVTCTAVPATHVVKTYIRFFLGREIWRNNLLVPIRAVHLLNLVFDRKRDTPLVLAHTPRILGPATFFVSWAACDTIIFVVTVAFAAAGAAVAATAVHTTPFAGRRPNNTNHRR